MRIFGRPGPRREGKIGPDGSAGPRGERGQRTAVLNPEMTHDGPARRCGALASTDGSVLFRVWAPAAKRVDLVLIDRGQRSEVAMKPESGGYFRLGMAAASDGLRYAFRLDGGPDRPDPCSLHQPEGVHRPSEVVRTDRFSWTDSAWKGVARRDLVLYELHVGTFSPEGTFDGAIPRLPELRELGVTAIEIMPVAQFPGDRNWGYDGTFLYAAQESYGGPEGLHRLVDACHAEGLAAFLDVVYNHLGPEGSYVREFGPYFNDHYRTPWGSAVNYDDRGSDAVRDFVLDNVRMWLQEFHLDGLRLDAVHAIYDLGARHILRAIGEVAEEVAARRGWPATIIAESDLNDPRLLHDRDRGGLALSAQWADDFHHAVHAYLTGERDGYYADFTETSRPGNALGPGGFIARALESPFVYAWEESSFRGRKHGAPPVGLSGDRFVVCLQNHDQVGNRPRGDRVMAALDRPKQRLAAGLMLLSPYLPMLFMGEEYGEESPFPFFCSFGDPELVRAVREGRKREFETFSWQEEVPDPQGEETFRSAKLSWSWLEGSPGAGLRRLYRDLLTARREWPALRDSDRRRVWLTNNQPGAGPVLKLERIGEGAGGVLQAVFNLGNRPARIPDWAGDRSSILFRSEAPEYGGGRRDDAAADELAPFEFVAIGPPYWRAFPGR